MISLITMKLHGEKSPEVKKGDIQADERGENTNRARSSRKAPRPARRVSGEKFPQKGGERRKKGKWGPKSLFDRSPRDRTCRQRKVGVG